MNQQAIDAPNSASFLRRLLSFAASRVPLVVFAFATLIFTAWLTFGPAQLLYGCDYVQLHHFLRVYLRNAILDGEPPLWNPYTLLGKPFMADPEAAVFYPPTWLWIVLPEAIAYWLVLWGHTLIGGAGMYKLAREWGAERYAALFAATAFVVSPPIIMRLQGGLTGMVFTVTWWPWMLLYVDRLCVGQSMRDYLKLSAVLTLAFFAGQTHAFWMCGISLGFYVLPRCIEGSPIRSLARIIRAYGILAAAAVMAFFLSAVEFLSLLELTTQSHRLSGRDFAANGSMDLNALLTLFHQSEDKLTLSWEGSLYIGIPVVAIGLWMMFHVGNGRMRGLLFMSSACILTAMGYNTPFFGVIYHLVPALGFFRFNIRLGMFVVFAIIVAASLFWNTSDEYVPKSKFAAMIWSKKRLVFALFVAIWLMDMIPHSVNAGKVAYKNGSGSDRVEIDFPEAIKKQLPAPRDKAPLRVFVPYFVLLGDSGMENGYSMVDCYMSLVPDRTWYYCYLAAGATPNPYQVTYLDADVFHHGPFPYKGLDVAVGWDFRDNCIHACDPPPRAWLVREMRTVGVWPEVVIGSMHTDIHKIALVEREYASFAADIAQGPIVADARITDFSRNGLVVDYNSDSEGLLVLAEAWYPGWRAAIDGKPVPVFPVNAWMRGVRAPSGVHTVKFSFRPTFLAKGATVSLLTCVLWLFLWCGKRKYKGK